MMKKTWEDIYYASKRRGDDPCYAMFLADQYIERKERRARKMAAGYDSTADTKEHIAKVQMRIGEVWENLESRAYHHDASKLEEPEKAGYDKLTIALKDCVYGSEEYRAALREAHPTIAHHYAANDHHPEHTDAGIMGMSLLSIIEMLCDWKAASERTKQGSIQQSLAHNADRFGVGQQLAAILENTVKELGW